MVEERNGAKYRNVIMKKLEVSNDRMHCVGSKNSNVWEKAVLYYSQSKSLAILVNAQETLFSASAEETTVDLHD